MNPALTIVLCGLCLFAATEADVICGSGELDNTRCTEIKDCAPIISRLEELKKSKNSNERYAYYEKVRNLKCDLATGNDKDIAVCCPVKPSTPATCGIMLEDKWMGDGGVADPLEYEWLALLEYNTPRGTEVHCSGVLISDRHVLTAASCLDKDLTLTGVRLGEYNLATVDDFVDTNSYLPKYASIGIANKKVHEKYSPLRGAFGTFTADTNDIAILTLARSVATQPICLPTQDPKSYKIFRAVGWGSTPYDKEPKFETKSQVVMRNSKCEMEAQNIICVQPQSKDYACVADVGGPLMQRELVGNHPFVVAGIYAPDSINPCRMQPKSYTNVFKYKDWIANNMH